MTTDSRNHRCSPGTWVSGAQRPDYSDYALLIRTRIGFDR